MNTKYLFPHNYKIWGWAMLIPSIIMGLASFIFNYAPDFLNLTVPGLYNTPIGSDIKITYGFTDNNILDEILGVSIIIGSILVAFSKQKHEDEFIAKIRLESLVWAVYVNYGILLLMFIFIYDLLFLWVMIFNIFTVLLFFIVRFNWKIAQLKQSLQHDQ